MSVDTEESTAVAVVKRESFALGNLEGDNLIGSATAIAKQLSGVVEQCGLVKQIRGRPYPKVEAWTTLGALLGCFAHEVSVEEFKPGVYRSTVEFVSMQTGTVISRASAQCGDPDELDNNGQPMWASRPAFARQSMATTRATGKAGRMAWSWIMALAGYEATPAEEMDGVVIEHQTAPPAVVGRSSTAQEPPHPADIPEPGAGDGPQAYPPPVVGLIDSITEKVGTGKNKKPYTRFGIKIDGLWFNTFSASFRTVADEAKDAGRKVKVVYEKTSFGNDIVEILPL